MTRTTSSVQRCRWHHHRVRRLRAGGRAEGPDPRRARARASTGAATSTSPTASPRSGSGSPSPDHRGHGKSGRPALRHPRRRRLHRRPRDAAQAHPGRGRADVPPRPQHGRAHRARLRAGPPGRPRRADAVRRAGAARRGPAAVAGRDRQGARQGGADARHPGPGPQERLARPEGRRGLRGRPAQLPRQGQGRHRRGAAQPAPDVPRPAAVTDAAAAGHARREGQADQPRGQQAGPRARRARPTRR